MSTASWPLVPIHGSLDVEDRVSCCCTYCTRGSCCAASFNISRLTDHRTSHALLPPPSSSPWRIHVLIHDGCLLFFFLFFLRFLRHIVAFASVVVVVVVVLTLPTSDPSLYSIRLPVETEITETWGLWRFTGASKHRKRRPDYILDDCRYTSNKFRFHSSTRLWSSLLSQTFV